MFLLIFIFIFSVCILLISKMLIRQNLGYSRQFCLSKWTQSFVFRIILCCVFVFTGFIPKASAQQKSRIQHFRELSRPEKWWVITHPFSAGRALEISLHARKMSKKMASHPLLDQDERGGQVDAFRHAYWMALLTQELNERRAWRLGYDHEKGNKRYFEKHQEDSLRKLPTAADCTMDMHNNEAGIEIGLQYPDASREEMQKIILKKLLKGHFIILKKDSLGYLLDCQGNRLHREDFENQWEIPACLVPSDYNALKPQHLDN